MKKDSSVSECFKFLKKKEMIRMEILFKARVAKWKREIQRSC